MLIDFLNNFSITIIKNRGGFQWLKTYFCFVCHCFFSLDWQKKPSIGYFAPQFDQC